MKEPYALIGVCHEAKEYVRKEDDVGENCQMMRAGLSKSAFRGRFQTT